MFVIELTEIVLSSLTTTMEVAILYTHVLYIKMLYLTS